MPPGGRSDGRVVVSRVVTYGRGCGPQGGEAVGHTAGSAGSGSPEAGGGRRAIMVYCMCLAVTLGAVPSGKSLEGTPVINNEGGKEQVHTSEEGGEEDGGVEVRRARQAASLLALLSPQNLAGTPSAKASKVWLGEGLGSIPKRTYDRMLKWEAVDMAEFRAKSTGETGVGETETEKLVVLPGFEVAQARKKPVNSILTWVQCFARYTAAMAQKFPECTPGFMSHMMVVLKASREVEDPAWRLYDEAYREKMASTGVRIWQGVDVQIYQETCGGFAHRQVERRVEGRGGFGGTKRPREKPEGSASPSICWLLNDKGSCPYGPKCRFPHTCEECGARGHGKAKCPDLMGPKRHWL